MTQIVLFNKPFRVLTQFTDDKDRATLADYIPIKNVYPAGRLDFDSEGLLILTDDGKLQAKLSSPKFNCKKVYWAQVEGTPDDKAMYLLSQGVTLKDGFAKAYSARIIATPELWPRNPPIRERKNSPTTWIEITLTEGRNRQVRRMTAHVGYPTLRLVRVQIGEYQLDVLQPGEFTVLK